MKSAGLAVDGEDGIMMEGMNDLTALNGASSNALVEDDEVADGLLDEKVERSVMSSKVDILLILKTQLFRKLIEFWSSSICLGY